MDFERARSNEQKSIRLKQITDSARKLFAEKKYEDITLAGIAKELSFTRANLYKYVASKEEIFLYIIIEDIRKWVLDLREAFVEGEKHTTEEKAEIWAGVCYDNQEMIKVLSLMYTIIEQNVTVEKLTEFKRRFFDDMDQITNLVASILPQMPKKNIIKFLQYQMHYIIGFYPATLENEIQRRAIKRSGVPYEKPDFIKGLKEFLIMVINSLS
jgi:AcrR family transcriptional regulator